MPHLSCLFHRDSDQAPKGSTSRPRVRDTLAAMHPFWKAGLDLSRRYLFFGPVQCHFLTPMEGLEEFIVSVVFSSGASAPSSTISVAPDQLPTHLITAESHRQCVTWQTLSLLQLQSESGHTEVWWRGLRPATGLQVPPSRWEGVRQNRMMVWLITSIPAGSCDLEISATTAKLVDPGRCCRAAERLLLKVVKVLAFCKWASFHFILFFNVRYIISLWSK